MQWRFVGSRPVSALADKVMRQCGCALPLLLVLVLFSGCVIVEPRRASDFTVVNNTHYDLAVYQDGEFSANLHPGGVLKADNFMWRRKAVTAVATDDQGVFIGSDSYIFDWCVPEIWTVSRLCQPFP